MQLSVVVPVYGSPQSLVELCSRLNESLSGVVDSHEIILVDDNCPHNSWAVIEEMMRSIPNVVGLKLSKNFGQHKAICAGLHEAKGDYCAVMDCDLQDLPEDIPTLFEKAQEGYDIVLGQRIERQDKKFKVLKSKVFYYFFNLLSGLENDPTVANFSVINRKVINTYLTLKEQDIDYTNFISWVGFDRIKIPVRHAERKYGESSYSYLKLFELAFTLIISESNKPLRFSVQFGFVMSVVSLLYGLFIIYKKYAFGVPIMGWTSVMVSIYFIGGLLFANMGVLGLYIGKIYKEDKARPRFIISKRLKSKH